MSAAYAGLESVLDHFRIPACLSVFSYYTGNRGTFRWKVVIKMNRIYQLSKSGRYLALKRQHLTSYIQLCLPVRAELLPLKAQQGLFAPLLVTVPDA